MCLLGPPPASAPVAVRLPRDLLAIETTQRCRRVVQVIWLPPTTVGKRCMTRGSADGLKFMDTATVLAG